MISAGVLTFREYAMNEPLPLATIQQAVFDFLRGRTDAVVFGAQAVNAYVAEPRMSQGIDLQSPRAESLAEELRSHLSAQFHIAVRTRSVAGGQGYRLYQVQESGSRHLVDIRSVASLPPSRVLEEILIAAPEELIAGKALACHRRRNQPKSGTDWRDLTMLLLAFPELKEESGLVEERLGSIGAEQEVFDLWRNVVAQQIISPSEDEEFL